DRSGAEEAGPRRARRAPARAGDRGDLPARDRAALALFPGRAVEPVRRLDLVRRDARGLGACRRPSARARRDLSFRSLGPSPTTAFWLRYSRRATSVMLPGQTKPEGRSDEACSL